MSGPLNNAIVTANGMLEEITKIEEVVSQHEDHRIRNNRMSISQQEVCVQLYQIVGNIQDIIKDVLESCKVSNATLNDLLTFDQLDEETLMIEMESVNPWELLQEVASPFSVTARVVNVNYSVQCEGGPSWTNEICLNCDKFKLSQVIRNLISNALKFTPVNGDVTVLLEKRTTSVNYENCDEVMLRLSVRDSGAGISEENQKKMFGQYVQFNAATLQNGKGSGLGLWISKSKFAITSTYCEDVFGTIQ